MPDNKIQLYQRDVPLAVNPFEYKGRESWNVEACAHSLAQLNRFTGHAEFPWSVGAHTLLVLYILRTRHINKIIKAGGYPSFADVDLMLAGLLHDAGEHLFNDIAAPVKHDYNMFGFRTAEKKAEYEVFIANDIHISPDDIRIKEADLMALSNEASVLFNPPHPAWTGLFIKYPPEGDIQAKVLEYHWRDIKRMWLAQYHKLVSYRNMIRTSEAQAKGVTNL